MRDRIKHSRFENTWSIIVFLIACFCFLALKDTGTENISVKKSVPANISVSINNAITGPVIKVQEFHKSWISDKDNFKLDAFQRNPLIVSKNTDLKLSQLNILRLSFIDIPQSILQYHLFPSETDDPQG